MKSQNVCGYGSPCSRRNPETSQITTTTPTKYRSFVHRVTAARVRLDIVKCVNAKRTKLGRERTAKQSKHLYSSFSRLPVYGPHDFNAFVDDVVHVR